MPKRRDSAGFTLLELMIVVVIIGILAAIAYPSYMNYIRKGRRQDAITTLLRIQMAQEKWRANNSAYASLAQLGMPSTSPQGYYTVAVSLPPSPQDQVQYTVTATAKPGSSQAKDEAGETSCATLQVNQDQPVYSPAAQKACWGR